MTIIRMLRDSKRFLSYRQISLVLFLHIYIYKFDLNDRLVYFRLIHYFSCFYNHDCIPEFARESLLTSI